MRAETAGPSAPAKAIGRDRKLKNSSCTPSPNSKTTRRKRWIAPSLSLFAALNTETAALHSESDWKTFRDRWLARKNGILTQVNDAG